MLNPNYKNKTCILSDLDGCLVSSASRFKRLDLDALQRRDTEVWVESCRRYNSDCVGDTIIDAGAEFLWALCDFYKPDKVFFVTARGIGGYEPTMKWLQDNNIFGPDHYGNELIMFPEDLNNFDFDTMLNHAGWKKGIAEDLIKQGWRILFGIDDFSETADAYLSLNIPVIHFMMPGLGRVLI